MWFPSTAFRPQGVALRRARGQASVFRIPRPLGALLPVTSARVWL
ncbi:hypothetical protein AWT69_004282 [Pseudomonas putida]|nr:hypothetical protein AWT69_004282 [Pseudomonas putida]